MSQTASPRSQRTVAGMVGALIVVVGLVVAVVWFRSSGQETTPVETVEWAPWVEAGRAEHQLMIFAPSQLPSGWRATSVRYSGGIAAHWHLGLLTASGKYAGIEESRASTEKLAEQYVDQDAVRGKDVTVAGNTWQTWTDAGGDYALVRSIAVGGAAYESVLVGGSATAADVKELVASLTSGTVRAAG